MVLIPAPTKTITLPASLMFSATSCNSWSVSFATTPGDAEPFSESVSPEESLLASWIDIMGERSLGGDERPLDGTLSWEPSRECTVGDNPLYSVSALSTGSQDG